MTFLMDSEGNLSSEPSVRSLGGAAQEACSLIYGERRQQYSDPSVEFEKIGALWTEILGQPVSPEQYCLCMIAMKLVRESGNHKRDNIIDMIGYAQILDDLRFRK